MIEIERVRRFEKRMNLLCINQVKTMMGLILYTSYQELNIFRNDNLATTGITDTLKCFDLPY